MELLEFIINQYRTNKIPLSETIHKVLMYSPSKQELNKALDYTNKPNRYLKMLRSVRKNETS